MKYYRRQYTWLSIDEVNRKTIAIGYLANTKSMTKHDASSDGDKFDLFIESVQRDLIQVSDYDEYLTQHPNTTKCIELTKEEFDNKKQEVIQFLSI